MPYGYFQFVRLSTCVGFVYLFYNEILNNRKITCVFSVICFLIFNPIFKIYLKRADFEKVDIVVATLLLVWIVADLLKKKVCTI